MTCWLAETTRLASSHLGDFALVFLLPARLLLTFKVSLKDLLLRGAFFDPDTSGSTPQIGTLMLFQALAEIVTRCPLSRTWAP